MMLRLPDEMLARAEADLEPHISDRLREQAGERGGGRLPQRNAQSRQQLVEQAVFSLAQRPRFPPTVGPETRGFGHGWSLRPHHLVMRVVPGIHDFFA